MADVQTVPSEVVKVELFEDRAAVTRRVHIPGQGRHVVVLAGLTPLVREQAVSFPGRGGFVVEDIGVERIRLRRTDADPEAIVAIEVEHRAAEERLRELRAAQRRAQERQKRATASLEAARGIAPRAWVKSDDAESWVDALRSLADAATESSGEHTRLAAEVRELEAEVERLAGRLATAREGTSVIEGRLRLAVLAEAGGEMLVRYVVPCAVWRPMHRAVLSTVDRGAEADGVGWEVRASCWNATGEDWHDVELVCSTARPGDHANPPRLVDDRVRVQTRATEVVVEARDETVQLAREQAGRAAVEIPGVDDGGEPRTFTAQRPVTLPSDGRPVQVVLESWAAPARVRWQAFPELSSAVVLRSTQENAGTRPLLAGPVELVRNGEAVGRGEVKLVPPGEPFSLGWGSHDGLRLVRRRDHEVERAMITGTQTHSFTVTLRISHLGDAPVRLEVKERVPVSEVKEVTVNMPKAEPALTEDRDRDGFCGWTLVLEPGTTRVLELAYTVEASHKVRLPF